MCLGCQAAVCAPTTPICNPPLHHSHLQCPEVLGSGLYTLSGSSSSSSWSNLFPLHKTFPLIFNNLNFRTINAQRSKIYFFWINRARLRYWTEGPKQVDWNAGTPQVMTIPPDAVRWVQIFPLLRHYQLLQLHLKILNMLCPEVLTMHWIDVLKFYFLRYWPDVRASTRYRDLGCRL